MCTQARGCFHLLPHYAIKPVFAFVWPSKIGTPRPLSLAGTVAGSIAGSLRWPRAAPSLLLVSNVQHDANGRQQPRGSVITAKDRRSNVTRLRGTATGQSLPGTLGVAPGAPGPAPVECVCETGPGGGAEPGAFTITLCDSTAEHKQLISTKVVPDLTPSGCQPELSFRVLATDQFTDPQRRPGRHARCFLIYGPHDSTNISRSNRVVPRRSRVCLSCGLRTAAAAACGRVPLLGTGTTQ